MYGLAAASTRTTSSSALLTSASPRVPKKAPAALQSAPAAVEASAASTTCECCETAPLRPHSTPAVVSTPSCTPNTISRTLESRSKSRLFSAGSIAAKLVLEVPAGRTELDAWRPIGGAELAGSERAHDAKRLTYAASNVERA